MKAGRRLYLRQILRLGMPKKITPTAGSKRVLVMHFIAFMIASIVMVMIHREQGKTEWAYPWHAWVIAAWGLSLIGHWCAVYFDYEDAGMKEFHRQANNG